MGAEVNHLGGEFIVVVGALPQVRIEPIAPLKSKSLCIEPWSALTFAVSTPPRMRQLLGGCRLLSDHEMYDRARPGRSEYGRVPTVGLTIGEPCERRQQDEGYTDYCRPGGRNVRKKPGALYE